MKLSTRSTYGLRALIEIGLCADRSPVSAAAIAGKQDLSVAYLEQLLHRLKKHGFVLSLRGPKGGYVLAREPEQITIGSIVQALEGPATAESEKLRESKERAQRIAYAVFRCVHERLAQSLEQLTLQDLCDEVREAKEQSVEHRYVFHN